MSLPTMKSKSVTPVPPRPSLRERNKARTRADLMDAALFVFNELGYAATSVDAICQHAGIARGTLYAHFPEGRDALLREIYVEIGNEVLARGAALREHARSERDRIMAMVRGLLEISADPLRGPFFDVAGSTIGPAMASVVGQSSKVFTEQVRADLAAARTQGLLRKGVVEDLLAHLLTGAARAAAQRVASGADNLELVLVGYAQLVDGLFVEPCRLQARSRTAKRQ